MILYLRYENGFGRLGGLMETAKCADEADLNLWNTVNFMSCSGVREMSRRCGSSEK